MKGSKKGDVLVFYYSGHGSQVADVSGDELEGKDETICPHDYATAGMIKDDDFRALLAGLPAGVNLDIILDSCHSGTGTCELAVMGAAQKELSVAYRYIEPPIDWGFFLDANPLLPVRGFLQPGGTGGIRDAVVVPGLNHVLWAGCRDNQTSGEGPIGGVVRGFFTYHFCKVLRGAGISITRRRLDAQVTVNLKNSGQTPQLEGMLTSINEKVFT
jgi:hypothetical protein